MCWHLGFILYVVCVFVFMCEDTCEKMHVQRDTICCSLTEISLLLIRDERIKINGDYLKISFAISVNCKLQPDRNWHLLF